MFCSRWYTAYVTIGFEIYGISFDTVLVIARFLKEREIKQRRLKKWWLSGICSQAKYIKHLSLAKFAVIKVISKYWFSTFTEWSNKVKIRFNNKVPGYKILSFSIVTSTRFSLFDSQLSVCLFFHCCVVGINYNLEVTTLVNNFGNLITHCFVTSSYTFRS